MRLTEVRDLIRPSPQGRLGNGKPGGRVLDRCHDVDDLRRAARRRLPRAVFDYIDGGADEEATIAANEAAYRRWAFTPRILQDVSAPDLTTRLFDTELPLPFGLAPTGYARMARSEGELAVAAASVERGVPFCVSTVATTAVEDVAAIAGSLTWCQLYLLRDRSLSWDLMERAYDSGVRVLAVSVDTPVAGHRTRDVKHGLTIPPSLTLGTLLDIGMHPSYWTRMLRSPTLEFANLAGDPQRGASVATISEQFDPAMSWGDLADIRDRWAGSLVLKGPISPVDANRSIALGVDGIALSNHGGRQLDRCVATLDLLRPLRDSIGEIPIIIDSGIRHGMDVAVALARGADFTMLGRPYLYGLAVAGQAGVAHAMTMIEQQLRRTLQLLGVRSILELREHADDLVVPAVGQQP